MSATPSAGALRAAEAIACHMQACEENGIGWGCEDFAPIIHEETQADTAILLAVMERVALHLEEYPEDSMEEALADELRAALSGFGKGAES